MIQQEKIGLLIFPRKHFIVPLLADPKPLCSTTEASIMIFIQLQVINLYLSGKLPFSIFFIPSIVFCVYRVIPQCYNWYSYHKAGNTELMEKQANTAINWIILLLFIIFVIIKYYSKMNWLLINLPFLLGLLIKLMYANLYWAELSSIKNMIINITVYAGILFSFLCTLKLEQVLKFSWTFAFWYFSSLLLGLITFPLLFGSYQV